MPLYGTNASASLPRSDRDATQSNSGSSSVTIAPDDDDLPVTDQSRQRLLGGGDKMALGEVLYAYDLTLAQLAYQRFGRARAMRVAWEVLSHTSDGIMWFLMVLPVVIIMWSMGLLDDVSVASKTVFIVFYACNIVDIIGIMILKIIFKRARPPHHHNDGRFVGPDQHSFPSGHATRSWCIVAFVVDLCNRHPTISRDFFRLPPDALRVVIVVWALAIGFSRVALGRHYPSDVLAGSLIGALVFFPISLYAVHHATSLVDY